MLSRNLRIKIGKSNISLKKKETRTIERTKEKRYLRKGARTNQRYFEKSPRKKDMMEMELLVAGMIGVVQEHRKIYRGGGYALSI